MFFPLPGGDCGAGGGGGGSDGADGQVAPDGVLAREMSSDPGWLVA